MNIDFCDVCIPDVLPLQLRCLYLDGIEYHHLISALHFISRTWYEMYYTKKHLHRI